MKKTIRAFALACAALAPAASHATSFPVLSITVADDDGHRLSALPVGATAFPSTFAYDGVLNARGEWDVRFAILADPDPFVQGVFAVSNQSNQTKQFHLEVTLPIAPPLPGATLVGGSVGGALTDANVDGSAVLDAPGLFKGYNDGMLALSIGGTGAQVIFAGQTINIPSQNVGLPGPTIAGPAALSDITLALDFSLTPGDQASFTALYVVAAVPEPTTAVLVLLGLLGLRRCSLSDRPIRAAR